MGLMEKLDWPKRIKVLADILERDLNAYDIPPKSEFGISSPQEKTTQKGWFGCNIIYNENEFPVILRTQGLELPEIKTPADMNICEQRYKTLERVMREVVEELNSRGYSVKFGEAPFSASEYLDLSSLPGSLKPLIMEKQVGPIELYPEDHKYYDIDA